MVSRHGKEKGGNSNHTLGSRNSIHVHTSSPAESVHDMVRLRHCLRNMCTRRGGDDRSWQSTRQLSRRYGPGHLTPSSYANSTSISGDDSAPVRRCSHKPKDHYRVRFIVPLCLARLSAGHVPGSFPRREIPVSLAGKYKAKHIP